MSNLDNLMVPVDEGAYWRVLAMAYDDVERARIVMDEQANATKAAKAAFDRAVKHVLDIVRDATRPRALPLFTATEIPDDDGPRVGGEEP